MDIRDRISKLLALGESPNEHEARLAILKARELMVKYKLRPEDFEDGPKKERRVIKRMTDVACTKMSGPWVPPLSATIAGNYCCKAFRHRNFGAKASTIGFVGMEDDLDVCEKVFLYAVDCVKSEGTRLAAELSVDASRRRELVNTFGFGFCNGLRDAFRKQSEEHQEWGLVLVTPTEVLDAINEMGEPQPYAPVTYASGAMARTGYAAGFEFDPRSRLNGDAR